MAIERAIHQIWIGDQTMPSYCREWCAEWKALHPGWKYNLFGNELYEIYRNDPYVCSMRDTSEKLAFISDRLRVLILRDLGGIYLDVDCQPVRKLDSLDHILNEPSVDFVAGLRSPDRKFVALHRGVSLIDNTVFGSAKNGRMANRLCALYRPEAKLQNGYSMGLEVLRHADHTVRLLNYRYFYAEHPSAETILLHDHHNLGSWSPPKYEAQQSKSNPMQPQGLARS